MRAPLSRVTLVLTLSLLVAPSLFAAMRGIVSDLQGDPIANARVTAHRWETPVAQRARLLAGAARAELAATTTDEHGAFSFDWKVGGMVEVRVERDGYAPDLQLVVADDELVFVELKRAPLRSGRVTANGKPVSNVLVVALSASQRVWSARTKEDGSYTIPDPKSWCSALEFVHPDFTPLSHLDTSRLDVTLAPGTAVTGTVSDASGRPVPKADVFAGSWSRTTTKDDGTFVLQHVAANEKKIAATDGASFGTATRKDKDVALRIEPLGTITGTVYDTNQRALEGMPVFATTMAMHGVAQTRDDTFAVTDAKGNYTIPNCEPSMHHVIASGTPTLQYESVTVTPRNNATARADLTATKNDFIAGTVVDEQKRPVQGAIVQLAFGESPLLYGSFEKGLMLPSTRTGRDGTFRLRGTIEDVIPMRLFAQHRGYAAGVTATLRSGSGPVSIVLPAGIELTGIVTNAEGSPVADAAIMLLQDPANDSLIPFEALLSAGKLRPFTESDAAGRFSIRLNSAVHDLRVQKDGYAVLRVDGLTPLAGQEPMKLLLVRGVEIRGRVASKDKTSASLAGMVVAHGADDAYGRATVAADGTFALTGLRPGRYNLAYRAENGRSAAHETEAPANDVLLELKAMSQIRGRVLDAGTREAIPRFTVQSRAHHETIDGDGTFMLPVEPGNVELSIAADGYVKKSREVTVDADRPAEITIELTRGRNASGHVTNEHGSPIGEAWIMTDDMEAMAQSSKDGEFHLEGLPRQAAKIDVRADGYVSRQVEVPAGDHDTRLDIVLTAGRTVSGHVVTHEGAPVEGARVTAMGDSMETAQTDATGAFTLTGLGGDSYMLQAERDELESEPTPLGNEAPQDLVLMMKPSAGAGRIHGVVKGFLGNGMVRTSSGEYASIGRDGRYAIERAPAGELELQASVRWEDGEATSAPVKVTVIAGGDVEANLEFRDDVVIRGVVTDSGAPAARRKVGFSSNMLAWSTRTDEHGAYELKGVEPGHLYDVEVSGGNEGRTYRTRHHVGGSGSFDINMEWSSIEGRVIDATGAPLSGAKITLATEQKQSVAASATDNTGVFEFRIAKGTHVITVVKEGFATFTRRVESATAPLLIRMTQSGGLRVRLTDARNGSTLDGYVVAIDAMDLEVARADEAEEGGAMLVPVAPGPYRIAVSANGFASQSARVSVPHEGEMRFALTPGGTLVVQTDRAAAELVRLVMPSGEEYVRCQCNGIAEIRLTGTTTTIEHVAPGTYTMQVLDANGLIKTSHPITIVEGQTTRAEIRVPE